MNKVRSYLWRTVLWIILPIGLYSMIFRFWRGLGPSTALSDAFPWGLWVGFKLFAVCLAGGGFTLAAVVYIFNIDRYRPVLRPMVLTAFLGYSMFVASLIIDLGRPYRVWHPMVMWNIHSVMFEIAWCVMLYTTVLLLEFLPAVFEKLKWERPLHWLHSVMIPIVIAGVILSTLHQSSLGSMYLIVPEKLYPLWYSPLEPIFFFISALIAGMAMTIFESWHSERAFGKKIEFSLLSGLGRVLAVLLTVYVTVRTLDLVHRGALSLLKLPRTETYLFFLEATLLIVPMVLLFQRRVHNRPAALYGSAVLVLLGLVTNRMNVAITGMQASSGTYYFPKWSEFAITLSLVALAFSLFWLAVKYLPIFPEVEEEKTVERKLEGVSAVPELTHVGS